VIVMEMLSLKIRLEGNVVKMSLAASGDHTVLNTLRVGSLNSMLVKKLFQLQSNWVITLWKNQNKLCCYKGVSL